MSGTVSNPLYAAYATTPFTDGEKTDIRRFCGFGVYGSNNEGFWGFRFFTKWEMLEYYMNNLQPSEYQTARGILAQCYTLENAIPAATQNLDTDKAAVWTHNKNEIEDRVKLLRWQCAYLGNFLTMPTGPFAVPGVGNGAAGSIRMVV